ncbi:MAG: DUF4259 domain-containing protein [Planctomycetaceae bacterium]|nr:DUF4259 domain-containing protein [Planctomycetaceae bacterium]
MGTWGPGNFDNDAARDYLFELTRDLAEQIDQALDEATSQKLAGQGSAELAETLESILPNVEIICVLHETLGGGFLPEPESAEDWQLRFEQISEDSSAERREVIRATFERLRQLAQQCWEE